MRRIASVRERRAERERYAAHQRLDHVAAQRRNLEREAAEARHGAEDAECSFVDDPSDPQALLWRQISRDRLSGALQRRSESVQQERRAQDQYDHARHLHERERERGKIVNRQAAHLRRRADHAVECREEEA